jgi:hypothetical protein
MFSARYFGCRVGFITAYVAAPGSYPDGVKSRAPVLRKPAESGISGSVLRQIETAPVLKIRNGLRPE